MFGSNNSEVMGALNYADALYNYNSVKPWRGGNDHWRPAGDRKHKHRVIHKDGNDIVYRFHNTDVVTFHPDNTATICLTWPTKTTQEFIDAVLKGPLRVQLSPNAIVWISRIASDEPEGYLVDGLNYVTIDLAHKYVKNFREIIWPRIDAAKAKAVRDLYEWGTFDAWHRAYTALQPRHSSRRHTPFKSQYLRKWTPEQVFEALRSKNAETFCDLVEQYATSSILEMIYTRHPETITSETRRCFSSYSNYLSWKKLDRKFG